MIASRGVYRGLLTYETVLALPGRIVLTVLNAIGATIYLARASNAWAIPQERAAGIYSVTGEPFVSFLGIWPIVGFFSDESRMGSTDSRTPTLVQRKVWLMAAMIWLVAVWIDFAHH
jgi:hypothetical protein